MITLKEALFSRKNIKAKILNLSDRKGTLSIEIAGNEAIFNYKGIRYEHNHNIILTISIKDAKSIVNYLGARHFKSEEAVYDINNKDNYIYVNDGGDIIIIGHRDSNYDVFFYPDEKQIKELKALFK